MRASVCWREQDRAQEERRGDLRKEIQVSLEQARRGELIDGEAVMADLRAVIDRHRRPTADPA